jgi:hypothetical protein
VVATSQKVAPSVVDTADKFMDELPITLCYNAGHR